MSLENVTHRDSKRPSERPRDREYHRRFSFGVPHATGSPPVPLGGHTWPRDAPFSPPTRSVVAVEMGLPVGQSGGQTRTQGNGRQFHGGRDAEEPYHIRLICAGDTVQHHVWLSMPISILIEEAGNIFGLDPAEISLVLFSASPVTLRRESIISGPPLVAPNSSVMIFSHCPPPVPYRPHYGHQTPPPQVMVAHGGFASAAPPVSPFISSKLLSSFKLPKFDGVSKNWKTWDRSFQRFLGLHSLITYWKMVSLPPFGMFLGRKKRTSLSIFSWRIRSLLVHWRPNTSARRQNGTDTKLTFSFIMGTCFLALNLRLSCCQS